MDPKYEEIIVKNFFINRIRDRILYELSSPKRRIHALNRLCHNYKDTLDEKYLIEVPKPNSNYAEIVSLLKKYGAGNFCYAISFNKDIDGKHLPLSDALKKAVGYGLPSLLICIPDELGYFESEQEFGSPKRFIIKKGAH
ncbi:hypothetical protein [Lihuaxuella thermophila]|uniref:Uncharacterized protein n=1 Tax=Lihuaxuella thermophila TaxID=1173111 RepID=A0A1H8HMP0_9BACL|nr:hypothetical protein [Lihuaxuella thermophila]SEN57276.1 hypothetical protein SAMN05444955_114105 [Lihuaxuella thermophila]